ncbi:hypothetical protein [Paenibacillus jilunlii]|uniref:Uncharacterized protein n=1 Tax=Paenibacillus jilunlii TaxID=682956 RepID=A0A1G9K352_9BACL|nr:hypothetical protein [Paenibacillus jilunlii]KWX70078.1 hypothetical protein AML91_30580 [Paenibacillus jilunlii]SDL43653.1 hypothetical protein SAMN05216191_10377 [Paenibacillus jilunlii]
MEENLRQRLGLPMQHETGDMVVTPAPNADTEGITVLNVSREDVEKGRLENYLREFKKYEKKRLRGKVTLIFNGYEQDRREIYQIREITNWMDRLLKNIPYLFYFLSRENYSMRIAFFCLSEVVGRSGVEVSITKEQGRRLIEKLVKSAVVYARKLKEPEEVQLALAEGILGELGYEQTQQ